MQTQTVAAVKTDRANVTTRELIALNQAANCCGKFIERVRDLDSINLGGGKQSFQVRFHPKDGRAIRSFITAHPFKYSATIVEPMHGDMHRSIGPLNQLSIHPNPL